EAGARSGDSQVRHAVALLLAVTLRAQGKPGAPIIRAHLNPATSVLVGEPVRATVEVLVPSFFTSAPEFPSFQIKSAFVVQSNDRPAHLNEQIGGESYAGLSQDYLIYPQAPGQFNLPPA